MKMRKTCPFCNKVSTLELNDKQYDKYVRGASVQVAFPKLSPFVRECIINGLCFDCQEKFYNKPAPGNEEKFGERLGSCSCCDRPVWSKDITDDKFICSNCGSDEYDAF